ncbi:MAG: outer membrane protein assembly factor BamA [Rhodobacteraceae bacterium]|nr:outer membrane protein assembly factor BamA [Paracoccaceae bacterium]
MGDFEGYDTRGRINGFSGGQIGVRTLFQRIVFVVFLALTSIAAISPQIASAQSYSFSSVQVEGNQRITAAAILSYLGIAKGETVSAAALNDGYQRLIASGLFEKVEVLPQGRLLVVRVIEHPTINRVSVEGNKRIKDSVLEPLLQSQERHVFSPSVAEVDAGTIVEVYQTQGRLSVIVEPKIIRRSNNRVDLVFEVTESRNTEIERLSFIGNREFSDSRLRRVLETKQAGILRRFVRADTFVPDRIEFDKQVLRDFYHSRGHVDFQTLSVTSELSRERDGMFITFTVREGQQFKFGEITTTSDLPEVDADEFHAESKLRSGTVYNPAVLESTINRMENLALQKGLNFVRVEPRITRNDRAQTLDIELVLMRGERVVVERIDIEGNATTLDRVVRNQFRIVEGDPFNPRQIRAAAERIRAMGFFATADVQAREGSAPGNVIIDVDVEEAPTGSFSFGGVYSLEQGFGLNLAYSESNLMGRGQFLSLSLVTGEDNGSFDFKFAEPHFLGRDLRFGVNASYAQSTQADEFYDTQIARLGTSLGFPISENGRAEVRVFGAGVNMDGYTAGSSALITAEVARGVQIGAGTGIGYSIDNRRSGLDPDTSVRLDFNTDFGGFGSDYNYAKTSASFNAKTMVINDQVTLRATVEGGALVSLNGASSRSTDRYFMGPSLLRGFAVNGVGPRDLSTDPDPDIGEAVGGNMFAVARLEAQFPVGLPEEYGISAGFFVDAGSVWGLDDDLAGAIDDDMHLRSVVGASLFWDTPIGPLRFNFSRALQKESYDIENTFEFTISSSF